MNLKVAQITQGNARASNLLCPAVHSVFTYSYLNNLKVCQLLTCWFSFCWCVLGRLVKMVFSISLHPDDGRLTEGTDSFFSPSSTLFFSKSKNEYEDVPRFIITTKYIVILASCLTINML